MISKLTFQHQLSIITVVLNGAKHIRQTIESVINQNFKSVEYIIIDGGSKDKSIEIIKEYEDKIDYFVSEKDEGISDAFNKGLAVATGEYVGIINSDDWYEPDCFEIISNHIQSNPNYDIYYGLTEILSNNGKSKILPVKDAHLFLNHGMTLTHPSTFIKRDYLNSKGYFNLDYKIAMDYELLLRYKTEGASFNFLNMKLANYRSGGLSQLNHLQGIEECKKAQFQCLKI